MTCIWIRKIAVANKMIRMLLYLPESKIVIVYLEIQYLQPTMQIIFEKIYKADIAQIARNNNIRPMSCMHLFLLRYEFSKMSL